MGCLFVQDCKHTQNVIEDLRRLIEHVRMGHLEQENKNLDAARAINEHLQAASARLESAHKDLTKAIRAHEGHEPFHLRRQQPPGGTS